MSLILIILLAIFFGYSLILVLANNREVEVNLLFAQVPSTNLGLVLILTIALGVIIGILVSLLLFKVFQNKLEIRRLKKEVATLGEKLDEAKAELYNERQALLELQRQPQSDAAASHNVNVSHDSENSI